MSATNVITPVDSRGARGAQIAASYDIRKRGDDWIIPSQSGTGTYRVRLGEPHLPNH